MQQNPGLCNKIVEALGLALADHAAEQSSVPAYIWDHLAGRRLVSTARREDGTSYYEMTDAGCTALAEARGPVYLLALCWACGEESPYPYSSCLESSPECPKCGAYADDE